VAAGLVRAVVTVAVIVVAYCVLPLTGHGAGGVVRPVLAGLAVVAVSAWEVREVSRSSRPRVRAIDAIAVSATTMIVAFAVLYLNIAARDPEAFNEDIDRTGALYFTMTTLTTIGYGDIVASSQPARIAVMVQMLFNVAVIGTTAKVIIGTAQRAHRRSEA